MQLTISLRRRLGWAGAILLLALGTAGLWTMRAAHAISLSQADIQSGLDRQLGKEIAVNGPSHLLLQSIRVKSAMVTLRDGKASFDVNLSGLLRNGKSFGIEATAAGLPEYADGALFFQPQNLDVRRLTYEGESAAEFVSRVAGNHVASERARALLNEKARMADGWANAAAENALRRFLLERPVYRLKDHPKGDLLKAALQHVSIEHDRLLVTFSFWRLTATTIAGAFSLLLGIILGALALRMAFLDEDIEISIT